MCRCTRYSLKIKTKIVQKWLKKKKKSRSTSLSSAECMRIVLIPLTSEFVMKHLKFSLHLIFFLQAELWFLKFPKVVKWTKWTRLNNARVLTVKGSISEKTCDMWKIWVIDSNLLESKKYATVSRINYSLIQGFTICYSMI